MNQEPSVLDFVKARIRYWQRKILVGVEKPMLLRVFAGGFWDVSYIPVIPAPIQKLFFGSLGGFQAMTGFIFCQLIMGGEYDVGSA